MHFFSRCFLLGKQYATSEGLGIGGSRRSGLRFVAVSHPSRLVRNPVFPAGLELFCLAALPDSLPVSPLQI